MTAPGPGPDPADRCVSRFDTAVLTDLADHLDWSVKDSSSYMALAAAAEYVARELRKMVKPDA